MDWLNGAGENARNEKEANNRAAELEKQLQRNFPDYCMQLWLKFDEVFKEIKKEFGDLASIKAENQSLRIIVGDVQIDAQAELSPYFGGYFASVELTYTVKNASRGPELPIKDILLHNYDDPKWVYLVTEFGRKTNKVFGREEIEAIFKTALRKYLKE